MNCEAIVGLVTELMSRWDGGARAYFMARLVGPRREWAVPALSGRIDMITLKTRDSNLIELTYVIAIEIFDFYLRADWSTLSSAALNSYRESIALSNASGFETKRTSENPTNGVQVQ